ncbi:fluoride efflux transporter CrcB [Fredinandcohnia humi]
MLLVGIGGAFGAASRYLVGVWIGNKIKQEFPIPTLFINILGSLLLGILTSLYLSHGLSESIWLLAGIGYCGAFTTFSTFGYEAVQLFLANRKKVGTVYIASSFLFCTFSAFMGMMIVN